VQTPNVLVSRMRPWWLATAACLVFVLALTAIVTAPPTAVTEEDALVAFRQQLAAGAAGADGGDVGGRETETETIAAPGEPQASPSSSAASGTATPGPTAAQDSTSDTSNAAVDDSSGGTGQDPADQRTSAPTDTIDPTPAPVSQPASPAVRTRPGQGVYSYVVEGGESIDIPGGSRTYPSNATSTLVHDSDACGWTVEMALAEEHKDLLDFCTSRDSTAMRGAQQYVEFFGTGETQNFRCAPALVIPAKPGGAATRGRCADEAADVAGDFVVTTTEQSQRTIGGTSVPAIRVVYEVTFSGRSEGSSTTDTWVHAQTGLLLRMYRTTDAMVETQAGRRRYQEEVTVELMDLTPRT
jgi:hypothetical protein